MATQAQLQEAGPFNDERFHDDPLYRGLRIEDWNILISAANRLHVTTICDGKEDEAEVYEIVYEVEKKCSDDDGDADICVKEAVEKLLEQLRLYGVLVKQDTDDFSYLIEKAKKDFEFYDQLRKPDLIEHDSSKEKVIEILSFEWAEWFSFSDVCGLVQDYISLLKKEHDTDLCYQYRLFLADSPSLEDDTTISCILAKLKKVDTFMKNGYDSIPPSDLEAGLQYFISFMQNFKKTRQCKDAKASYKKKVLKMCALEKSSCEKLRRRFPKEFTDAYHFLAFKARGEGYDIQHPVLELAKLRAYFNHVVLNTLEISVDQIIWTAVEDYLAAVRSIPSEELWGD